VKTPIEKPKPIASNHTDQKKPWTVPIPRISGALIMILSFVIGRIFILGSNPLDKENVSPTLVSILLFISYV
jgi:hypothetical protein